MPTRLAPTRGELRCQVAEVAGLLGAAGRHRCRVEEQHDRARRPAALLSLRAVPVWSGSSNSATTSPRFMSVTLRLARSRSPGTGLGRLLACDANLDAPPPRRASTSARWPPSTALVPVTRKVLADSRDPAVRLPQAGRQPARHVPARVGRERPVVVAMVVHRCRRAVGVDRA